MRATLLVRPREKRISTATTNIMQYYTVVTVDIVCSLDLTSSVALILY
jgi:hypothetical protein